MTYSHYKIVAQQTGRRWFPGLGGKDKPTEKRERPRSVHAPKPLAPPIPTLPADVDTTTRIDGLSAQFMASAEQANRLLARCPMDKLSEVPETTWVALAIACFRAKVLAGVIASKLPDYREGSEQAKKPLIRFAKQMDLAYRTAMDGHVETPNERRKLLEHMVALHVLFYGSRGQGNVPVLKDLAEVYTKIGDEKADTRFYAAAERLRERVVAILENKSGVRLEEQVGAKIELSQILRRQQLFVDANKLMEPVEGLCQATLDLLTQCGVEREYCRASKPGIPPREVPQSSRRSSGRQLAPPYLYFSTTRRAAADTPQDKFSEILSKTATAVGEASDGELVAAHSEEFALLMYKASGVQEDAMYGVPREQRVPDHAYAELQHETSDRIAPPGMKFIDPRYDNVERILGTNGDMFDQHMDDAGSTSAESGAADEHPEYDNGDYAGDGGGEYADPSQLRANPGSGGADTDAAFDPSLEYAVPRRTRAGGAGTKGPAVDAPSQGDALDGSGDDPHYAALQRGTDAWKELGDVKGPGVGVPRDSFRESVQMDDGPGLLPRVGGEPLQIGGVPVRYMEEVVSDDGGAASSGSELYDDPP